MKPYEEVKALLSTQQVGVLATSLEGHPYTTLVAFDTNEDLTEIYFATHQKTRKHANILLDERVSLLVDNRKNDPADFRQAAAVTALGRAYLVEARHLDEKRSHFLRRHPSLKTFFRSPSIDLFIIRVEKYCLVHRFQDVVELEVPIR